MIPYRHTSTGAVKAWCEAYFKKFNTEPNSQAVIGYNTVMTFAHYAQVAGKELTGQKFLYGSEVRAASTRTSSPRRRPSSPRPTTWRRRSPRCRRSRTAAGCWSKATCSSRAAATPETSGPGRNRPGFSLPDITIFSPRAAAPGPWRRATCSEASVSPWRYCLPRIRRWQSVPGDRPAHRRSRSCRDRRRCRRHIRNTVWQAWCNRPRPAPPSCPAAGHPQSGCTPPARTVRHQSENMRQLRHAILLHDTLTHHAFSRYGRIDMSDELSGRVAVVTGGASGIGAASAALLAAAGAAVIVADLAEGSKETPVGRFVTHDVASEESWQSLLARHPPARGPARHHGQQCRHLRRSGQSRDHDRRELAARPGDQFRGRVPRLQVRHPGHEASRRGQDGPRGLDRQHLLDRRPGRRRRPHRLHRQQGRGAAAEQERGALLRRAEIRHPLQLGASGRRRHRDLQSAVAGGRPRAGQGLPRLPPSDRPHGRAAGSGRARPVAGLGPLLLRHRCGVHVRRRHHRRTAEEVAPCPVLRTRSSC